MGDEFYAPESKKRWKARSILTFDSKKKGWKVGLYPDETIMMLSKYNVVFDYNEKKYIFNTHSLAIVEIDNAILNSISNNINAESDEKTILTNNGMIVNSADEEYLEIKNDYWQTICSNKAMYLSIMPTLNCNLRCPYCFEHHSNCNMSDRVADSIISIIDNKIKNDGLESLKIDWYGGEPTLRMDIISDLSTKVQDLCRKNNITYLSTITTNASLMNEEKAKQLKEAGVSFMQITIDGPKDVHDTRRIGADGSPTFDTIIDFIKQYKNQFDIVIRINIDKTNENAVDRLLVFLAENNLNDVRIAIKGVVSSEERDVSDTELSGKELSDLILEKYKYAAELGLNPVVFSYFDSPSNFFCIVDCLNQFIITPDGRLFKCGESYLPHDPGYVGQIDLDNQTLDIDELQANIWTKDPFADTACADCEILPMCYGGCQMKRNVKKIAPCNTDLKYHLIDYLKLYLSKMEKEGTSE